jgi:hypothetical protein
VHFESLEQTLRLRLVSEHVDKKFFFLTGNSLSHTVCGVIHQKLRLELIQHAGYLVMGLRCVFMPFLMDPDKTLISFVQLYYTGTSGTHVPIPEIRQSRIIDHTRVQLSAVMANNSIQQLDSTTRFSCSIYCILVCGKINA